MDVYRAVFSLRREVFTNRPIPNDAGKTSPEDEQWFQTQCNAICVTLKFLVCVLDPALPEENGNVLTNSHHVHAHMYMCTLYTYTVGFGPR